MIPSKSPTIPPTPAPRRTSVTIRVVVVLTLLLASLATSVGQAPDAGAIVNGTKAQLGEIPFQISLEDDQGQMCGGSLIEPNVVLTAAHCLDGMKASELNVRSGIVSLRQPGQLRDVARMVVHPEWGGVRGDTSNDIALLFVDNPFELDANTQTITAVSPDVRALSAAGTKAVVSGWGAPGENSDRNPIRLHQATVTTVGDVRCGEVLDKYDDFIDEPTMLCADGAGGGGCYGDSGGPLAAKNAAGQPVLIGIVSWGIQCGLAEVSGIFTEVARYDEWISAELNQEPVAPEPEPEPEPEPAPQPGKPKVFTEKAKLKIPGLGEASDFPSVLEVAGVGNELTDVDVIIKGFKHARPSDVDLILVSPEGTEVTLMSGGGGEDAVKRIKLRFDDAAQRDITLDGLDSGRYRPMSAFDGLPDTDLSVFEGEDPNGEWELYAYDAVRKKRGKIFAWKLVIESR